MIFITVLGDPVAKGRPRFARRGKFVSTYSPAKTVDYAAQVAHHAKIAMACRKPLEGALRCFVLCYMPIPKSTSKKIRQAMIDGEIHHTKKPDTDNLAKGILDPLNGIAWNDDAQIIDLQCCKYYSDNPRTEIRITPA